MARRRWRAFIARCLTAAALAGSCGCLCYLHSLPPPNHPCSAPCVGIPKCARDKVHIVLVHGADPFDCANLEGVRERLHLLGFLNIYSGSPLRKAYFAQELRRVAREVTDAHFVLIGFGHGVATAETLAREVAGDGITFDRLIRLNAQSSTGQIPENVQRVVSVRGGTHDKAESPGHSEHHIESASHFGTPTHPRTLETIAEELQAVAMSVPVVLPPEPVPLEETAPTPRPVPPSKATERDEWDFLKPVPRLESSSPR
jgi:hypothetical protein